MITICIGHGLQFLGGMIGHEHKDEEMTVDGQGSISAVKLMVAEDDGLLRGFGIGP